MPYPTPLRSYSPSDITPVMLDTDDIGRLSLETAQWAERVAPLLARTGERLAEIDRRTYDRDMDLMPIGAYSEWSDADRDAWQARTNVTRDLANRADNAERASSVAWDVADGVWY